MRALVVEDDALFQTELRQMLEGMEGIDEVLVAGNAAAAMAVLDEAPPPAVVLLDVYMPRDASARSTSAEGPELALKFRKAVPEARVLIISSVDRSSAVGLLLDEVADDFITKDSTASEIEARIRHQVLAARRDAAELTRSGVRVGPDGIQQLIGSSPAMRAVRERLSAAAATNAPVLITGESGCGKELAAWTLHRLSPWARGPFLPFNAAAVGEGLLESELFGHKKGAFTGAQGDRAGVVESAAGGTLFLDEIGELPLGFQVKLLRFLDTGRFHRLGEDRPRKGDVRLVFATNRDLEAEVRAGRFREDFFYRLDVLRVHLPPLRERPEDIGSLARYMVQQLAGTLGRIEPELSNEAVQRLKSHAWPGNGRELRNVLERAMILHPRAIIEAPDLECGGGAPGRALAPASAAAGGAVPAVGDDLPFRFRPGLSFKQAMEGAESWFLRQALEAHDGNVTATAKALGMGRRTLQERMARYGLRGD